MEKFQEYISPLRQSSSTPKSLIDNGKAVFGTFDCEERYFAFNLTRNQSIDQDRYNENLIWFENKISLLPPVIFVHNVTDTIWTVRDEHDMVDITFQIGDMYRMETHAGVVDINYHVAFGEISGYIRDTEGTKYILDKMMGMGKDKSLRL